MMFPDVSWSYIAIQNSECLFERNTISSPYSSGWTCVPSQVLGIPRCLSDILGMLCWCLGPVSVLPRCLRDALVISRRRFCSQWCLGDGLVMFQGGLGVGCCVSDVWILCRWCFADVSGILRWWLSDVSMVSHWCLGLVRVVSQWCFSDVLLVFRGCFGDCSAGLCYRGSTGMRVNCVLSCFFLLVLI